VLPKLRKTAKPESDRTALDDHGWLLTLCVLRARYLKDPLISGPEIAPKGSISQGFMESVKSRAC